MPNGKKGKQEQPERPVHPEEIVMTHSEKNNKTDRALEKLRQTKLKQFQQMKASQITVGLLFGLFCSFSSGKCTSNGTDELDFCKNRRIKFFITDPSLIGCEARLYIKVADTNTKIQTKGMLLQIFILESDIVEVSLIGNYRELKALVSKNPTKAVYNWLLEVKKDDTVGYLPSRAFMFDMHENHNFSNCLPWITVTEKKTKEEKKKEEEAPRRQLIEVRLKGKEVQDIKSLTTSSSSSSTTTTVTTTTTTTTSSVIDINNNNTSMEVQEIQNNKISFFNNIDISDQDIEEQKLAYDFGILTANNNALLYTSNELCKQREEKDQFIKEQQQNIETLKVNNISLMETCNRLLKDLEIRDQYIKQQNLSIETFKGNTIVLDAYRTLLMELEKRDKYIEQQGQNAEDVHTHWDAENFAKNALNVELINKEAEKQRVQDTEEPDFYREKRTCITRP